jgi:hypothetical protein
LRISRPPRSAFGNPLATLLQPKLTAEDGTRWFLMALGDTHVRDLLIGVDVASLAARRSTPRLPADLRMRGSGRSILELSASGHPKLQL